MIITLLRVYSFPSQVPSHSSSVALNETSILPQTKEGSEPPLAAVVFQGSRKLWQLRLTILRLYFSLVFFNILLFTNYPFQLRNFVLILILSTLNFGYIV